jgi:hypothetical protein
MPSNRSGDQVCAKLKQIAGEVAPKYGLAIIANREGLGIHQEVYSDMLVRKNVHMEMHIDCGRSPIRIYLTEHPASHPGAEHLRLMRELARKLQDAGFRVEQLK